MDSAKLDNLTQDMRAGRISRRTFLRTAIGLGVSMSAASGLLQACAPSPGSTTPPTGGTSGGKLVVGLGAAPRGVDPFYVASSYDFSLMANVFDSLFDLDYETLELKPVLVEEWEQQDELTWSFKLKEGVQFHKGYGEVTSEDWAFWVNEVVQNQMVPYFILGNGLLEEVVPTGKYTFEAHLAEPWAPFALQVLVGYGGVVLSKKAYEEMGPEKFAQNPVGAGPFELESWTPGGEVVMKKFEDYHMEGYPLLDELVWQGIEDVVVRMEKVKKGEIDWATELDKKYLPELQDDPNLQVLSAPAWNWDYITFNLDLPDRPWLDKRVRQAVSYAIDRQAIVDTIYYGGATPEDDSLPPGYLGDDPDPKFYPNTADLDKARALLEEAGYPDGFTMPCLTSQKPNLRRELQLGAEQLRQVGINVEIEQTDAASFRNRWDNSEFETFWEDAGMMSPDSDAAMYWWYHTSPPDMINNGNDGYSNAEVDKLLDDARKLSDPEERAAMYRQAVEIIAEDSPKVIVCNVNQEYVLRADVTGFYPSPRLTTPLFRGVARSG